MPYTIQEQKIYPFSKEKLSTAVLGAIEGLEGAVLQKELDKGQLDAKFPKTILGNVLGDRTKLEIMFEEMSKDETKLSLTIYPINPVGQKLQFGARKGVPRKVMDWFLAHVDHRLK